MIEHTNNKNNPDKSQNDKNSDNIKITDDLIKIPQIKSQFVSVLKIRNFMIFGISQSISLFGDKLDYMALLAVIAFFADKLGWDSSSSARAVSYLSVVTTLPPILLGPIAGVLVDRWNRLKVLLFCDLMRALLVLFIPFLVIKTYNLMGFFFLTFIIFLFGLFYNTARLSIIPNLVSRKRLLAANSFMNVVGRIATFLGMFFGGIIVDWHIWKRLGFQYSWSAGFYIDALTYLVSVSGLIFIATRTQIFKVNKPSINMHSKSTVLAVAQDQEKKMFSELKFAFNYIIKTPLVRFVFISIFIMVLIGACAFVLLVPMIQSPVEKMGFGLGTKGVGFVAAIGAIGLVISSMSYGIIGHRFSKIYTIVGSFCIMGLVIILIPILNNYWALMVLALITGLVLSPVFIAQDTILHEIVPEEIRGRIFSTREWLLNSSFAVVALIVGQLTNFVLKQHLLIIVGCFVIVISGIFIFYINKQLLNKRNKNVQNN